MTTPYENILAALTTYAPADRVEALVRDLDAMRASAREEVLDEVAEALESYGSYMISMPVVRKYLDTLRDQRPADPEQARLEREVAEAAVALTHAFAAAVMARGGAIERAASKRQIKAKHAKQDAEDALFDYIIAAKREGGAK